jgi:hypothetical protein
VGSRTEDRDGRFLEVRVPEHLVEAIADAVAERLSTLHASEPSSPWLCGAKQVAEYLGWPIGRVHKYARQLPCRKVGGRLMYRRDELDAFIDQHPDPSGWSRRRSTSVPRRLEPA